MGVQRRLDHEIASLPIAANLHRVNDIYSYNDPKGQQMVIRESDGKRLMVFHRFADSVSMDEYMQTAGIDMAGYTMSSTYGKADRDFSAKAVIMNKVTD